MVQLCILSGNKAGSQMVVRRFPFTIGRSAGSDLSLEDEGVWERHLTLEFQNQEQFMAQSAAGALLAINQKSVQTAPLRNGDILTLGSVKLQFWLAPARQRGLKFRESLVWGLLAVVTLIQLALIYWLDY